MTKEQLAHAVADRMGCSFADGERFLNAFSSVVFENIRHHDIRFRGFGTFTAVMKKERSGYNPYLKTETVFPEKWVPKFKPAAKFKETLR